MDNQTPKIFGQTPWQTVGPFFHYSLAWKGAADLVGQSLQGAQLDRLAQGHDHLATREPGPRPEGVVINVFGRVLDGAGEPVPDAMLETWQANASGHYSNSLANFGRCATDNDGCYRFTTVRPGAVIEPTGTGHAPQISLGVFARGITKRLLTRIYFEDAPENAHDPALAVVQQTRRKTLLAQEVEEGWRFDVILQGDDETVFFQC